MNFWIVTCVDMSTELKIQFTIATDKNAEKKKIKKDLKAANPQYKKISLKKGKKPAGWSMFESES